LRSGKTTAGLVAVYTVAAREVVRNSDAAAKLMAGLEEMQAEVVSRRVALRFMVFNDLVAEPGTFRAFLENKDLPGGYGAAEWIDWSRHGAHVSWKEAFAKLLQDADAPLPAFGT
jgi:hypothetical protein